MKKNIRLIIVVLFASLILTGCFGFSGPAPSQPPQQTEAVCPPLICPDCPGCPPTSTALPPTITYTPTLIETEIGDGPITSTITDTPAVDLPTVTETENIVEEPTPTWTWTPTQTTEVSSTMIFSPQMGMPL